MAGDEPSSPAPPAENHGEPKDNLINDSDHRQLCFLIDDSLHPYTDSQTNSLTKEKEKNLLIILSQVSRKIRDWENLGSCHHHTQEVVFHHSHSGDHQHNCSAHILSNLVSFLTVESQHVRQSTSNLLVVVSDFFAKSGKKWTEFLDFLCVCLKVAISNLVSTSSSLTATSDSKRDDLNFVFAIQGRFEGANWLTVVCLIQVLRSILKHLKQDHAGELVETYLLSVSYCLADMSWDFLSDNHACQMSEAYTSSEMNDIHHEKVGSPKSRFLFSGALLQLFCSLTQQSNFVEAGDGFSNKYLLLDKLTNLIPKLLSWCFYKQGVHKHLFGSRYLRHKMLMLMIRLSSQIRWECCTLILWLQLLRENFEDILDQPISIREVDIDDCLEGSPFQAEDVGEEVHKISTPHLQRQAIFLYLRCSFILISLGKETDFTCSCAPSNPILNHEIQFAQECHNRKKGVAELSEWLQRQVHLETFVDAETYREKSRRFAQSFLQLYMDEDDILFEVLLQLLNLPFPAKHLENAGSTMEKGNAMMETEGAILIHLWNILNPVQIFHLFLAELHYDHEVLLDYLISKDTGVYSVQYLLRSLRTISNLWHTFVEYSVDEVESIPSSVKKQKVNADSDRRIENNLTPIAFHNARQCLLSLERSVKNLHKKNLFPYNPTALLRSFTRFQERCNQEMD